MPGSACVPTPFAGMPAVRWSAPANGRIHRDKRRRDVCATQFSSVFTGRTPMGTGLKAGARKMPEQSENVYENKG